MRHKTVQERGKLSLISTSTYLKKGRTIFQLPGTRTYFTADYHWIILTLKHLLAAAPFEEDGWRLVSHRIVSALVMRAITCVGKLSPLQAGQRPQPRSLTSWRNSQSFSVK